MKFAATMDWDKSASFRLGLIWGCGFLLAFGAVVHLSKPGPTEADVGSQSSRQNEVRAPTSVTADAVNGSLKRSFLSEGEWSSLLDNLSEADLLNLIDAQPAEFWKSKPLGVSGAYRLFGTLGRSDAVSALQHAIQVFTRPELGRNCGRACFRWAVLGIVESQNSVNIETGFDQSPKELRGGLLQGAIGGQDSGRLPDDFEHFSGLLSRFLPADGSETKNLLHDLVEAWVERDPSLAADWLQTKEGKPYQDLLVKAVALACLGQPEEPLKHLSEKNGWPIDAAATALYENGSDANDILAFVAKLSQSVREKFLAAYGRELANGPAAVLLQFVETADLSLFTPELAAALGEQILDFAPQQFEKLTARLTPIQRNKLLVRGGHNEQAASLYLKYIGTTGNNARPALGVIARSSLEEALSFVDSAPQSQQEELRRYLYSVRASYLVNDGASFDELLAFAKASPAELAPEITESFVRQFAMKDRAQCLEILEKDYPNDVKMWGAAFGSGDSIPTLNADELNDFLEREITKGISPAAYSAAARAMTEQFAQVDTAQARSAVEALTDPNVRAACTTALVKSLASTDPLGAAQCARLLPAGEDRDSAIGSVLPELRFAPDQCAQLLSMASSDQARAALRAQMDAAAKKSSR